MVFCGAFVGMSLKLVWAPPRWIIATTSPNFRRKNDDESRHVDHTVTIPRPLFTTPLSSSFFFFFVFTLQLQCFTLHTRFTHASHYNRCAPMSKDDNSSQDSSPDIELALSLTLSPYATASSFTGITILTSGTKRPASISDSDSVVPATSPR